MKKTQSKPGFLDRISISTKIVVGVLTFGVVAVIATTLLIGQAVKTAMLGQFESAHVEITKLVASNAAGALRWKKAEAVAEAYKGIVEAKAAPARAIVATDAKGAKVDGHSTETMKADTLAEVVAGLLPMEAGASRVLTDDNGDLVVVASAGKDKKGEPYGFLAIAWRTDELHSIIADRQLETALMLGGAFIVLAVGVVFLFRFFVSGPLNLISARIVSLSEGDTEADIPFETKQDEIGKIASSVAVFRRREIKRIELEAQKRAEDEQRLKRQQTVDDLTSAFRGSVAELVAVVESQMDDMRSTASDLSQVASMTTDQARTVNEASDRASTSVQAVSSAAEELTASIREIGGQVGRTAEVVAEADRQAREAAAKMNRLSSASDKIGEVVTLIRDIAEKTNLLALNATIESARAGEVGKGFAVVASEVKSLATQTAQATNEIASQIEHIQSETQSTEGDIQAIVKTMADISELSSAIAASMDQQSSATDEISQSISGAAQSAREVSETIGRVAESAANAEQASGQVNTVSDEVDRKITSLRSNVEEFSARIAAV